MKRFWTSAAIREGQSGWAIELDGRPLKTPGRSDLSLPTRTLAEAIVEEWNAIEGDVDPRLMPLTGLANAAIDRIAADQAAFAASLVAYGESDLLCYRADHPQPLVDRQSAEWNPLLQWARRRYEVEFSTTSGIGHIAQPAATIERLSQEVAALGAFELAGLSPLVTIGGSLVAALAIFDQAKAAEEVWRAVTIDNVWQAEQWGKDCEAQAVFDNRHRDFLAAARFLTLIEV